MSTSAPNPCCTSICEHRNYNFQYIPKEMAVKSERKKFVDSISALEPEYLIRYK